MSEPGSERHKHLGVGDDGCFTLVRDLERANSERDYETGTRMKLLDVVLVGRTYFARIRPKHHEDEDAFLIALDKLF